MGVGGVILGGETLIEEGAKARNEFSGLIDTSRQKEVAFKVIVTATGDCAYQRPDGIVVCPLGVHPEVVMLDRRQRMPEPASSH